MNHLLRVLAALGGAGLMLSGCVEEPRSAKTGGPVAGIAPAQGLSVVRSGVSFQPEKNGSIAVDPKWSNYGRYLQKMIETVQDQWDRIMIESRSYPVSGTSVKVVFRMNSDGAISQIVNVEGTAGSQFEKTCTAAITARAPYGPWTDDMKAVLGESQEMTFTFYYQ